MSGAHEPVQVAEPPGGQAETSDAEKGVEDLAVNFEPDLAWGVVVVGAGVVHGRGGFEKEEEEHSLDRGNIVSMGIRRVERIMHKCETHDIIR